MPLPALTHRLGYSKAEVLKICRDHKVHHATFWKAWGVNTVAIDETGQTRYYPCDIERALYQLKKKDGVNHVWD